MLEGVAIAIAGAGTGVVSFSVSGARGVPHAPVHVDVCTPRTRLCRPCGARHRRRRRCVPLLVVAVAVAVAVLSRHGW